MNKFQKELIINEIKYFGRTSKKYNYRNIDELIGHYIEESVIITRKELTRAIALIKNRLGVRIDVKNFRDCFNN